MNDEPKYKEGDVPGFTRAVIASGYALSDEEEALALRTYNMGLCGWRDGVDQLEMEELMEGLTPRGQHIALEFATRGGTFGAVWGGDAEESWEVVFASRSTERELRFPHRTAQEVSKLIAEHPGRAYRIFRQFRWEIAGGGGHE